MLPRALIGTTLRVRWISSATNVETIGFAVYDGSETLVDSTTMSDSGNGHHYGYHTVPDSPGYYVVETVAWVGGLRYKKRLAYKAVIEEVD